ncbi:M20/M25/M40 family metallo-hydrolase [Halorarius halobius]|uniref:M20/M25/M40 family metallo-hydrolase n=1 Tax=Halorarius halobius TaxID=2962671 RepID=UPI0020CE7AE6|nr:M28 family metallopeptidase [Halorarius halobius]
MDWIGETFTSEVGWSHLETLVDIGDRMAGSDGELQAARATRRALAEHADDAWLEEFDIQGWTRGSSAIEAGDERLDCIALPRSPGESVTAEFVDLGYGLPDDFKEADLEGKVVMCASNVPSWYDRLVHRREKYYHAVEAGAAVFVFRNHVEGCLAPTGSVGTEARPVGDIPAVGVSKEVGTRLARRHDGESVTVSVEAATHDATSQNVHATLGGDGDADERVLVTSHVDAHDIAEGAVDNGAGTAMVVELARVLAARRDDLETPVEFVCFGAEEVGLEGSEHLADAVDPERVKAVVNNDGVVRGRDLAAYSHGFPELRAAAERVSDRLDHPITVTPEHGPHSDHWPFVERGLPGYHLHSETGDEGRGWGHTRADTLDKLEKRNFRELAIVLAELVVEVASDRTAADHRDTDAIARELEAQDLAEGMKVTGDWPY